MKIFKYEQIYAKKGGSHNDKHLVAEVEASNLIEADKLLKEFCGIDPVKTPMVVVSIQKQFSFNPDFEVDFEAGTAIL
jgi:hypothetical protein